MKKDVLRQSRSPRRIRHLPFVFSLCCAAVTLFTSNTAVAASPAEMAGAQRWTNLGHGILRDGRTGLSWTQKDNGSDISWIDAKAHCAGKSNGWRLPSLDELIAIYDAAAGGVLCAQARCKISSQFTPTGSWFWSATQVGKDSTDGIELAWGVQMINGARTQSVMEASYGSRALCVQGP